VKLLALDCFREFHLDGEVLEESLINILDVNLINKTSTIYEFTCTAQHGSREDLLEELRGLEPEACSSLHRSSLRCKEGGVQ